MSTSSTYRAIPTLTQASPCMAKLDRLKWNGGFVVAPLAATVGFRTNDPSLLESIVSKLPEDWTGAGRSTSVPYLVSAWAGLASQRRGVDNYHVCWCQTKKVVRTKDRGEFVREVSRHFHTLVLLGAPDHFGLCGRLLPFQKWLECSGDSSQFVTLDSKGLVRSYPEGLALSLGVKVDNIYFRDPSVEIPTGLSQAQIVAKLIGTCTDFVMRSATVLPVLVAVASSVKRAYLIPVDFDLNAWKDLD